jgi:hypothetical protein
MTTVDRWLMFSLIVGGVVVLLWLIYWVYRAKQLEREERRLMIERGVAPPAPAVVGWPAMRAREAELRFQERRLLIEKGLNPGEANPDPFGGLFTRKRRPEHSLYRGLVMLAVGIGLLAPDGILRWIGVPLSDDSRNFTILLAVIGPVVALYGAANIIYYRLAKDRPQEAASQNSQDSRSGS